MIFILVTVNNILRHVKKTLVCVSVICVYVYLVCVLKIIFSVCVILQRLIGFTGSKVTRNGL